ncbi:hypothetical protein ACLK1T_10950 [Escherichia coli]
MDYDANIISVSQREFEQNLPKTPGWEDTTQWKSGRPSSTLVEVLAKADISSD